MDRVVDEHGEEAAIAAVNRIRSGGVAGFFCREEFEVVVDPEAEASRVPTPVPDQPSEDPSADETIGEALARTTGEDRPPANLAYRGAPSDDAAPTPTPTSAPPSIPPSPTARQDDRDHRGVTALERDDGVEPDHDDDEPGEIGAEGDHRSVFAGPVAPGSDPGRDRFLALLERRLDETSATESDLRLRRANRDAADHPAKTPAAPSVPLAPAPSPDQSLIPGASSAAPPRLGAEGLVRSTPAEPRPVFWRRLDRAGEELASYLPAGSPRTAVVGPLASAVAVVHRLQSTVELASADVVVLTDRAGIVSEPSWLVIRNGDRLVRHLAEHEGRPAIVVIDVPIDLPHWVAPLQRRLRSVGVGLFRYAVTGQPTGQDLERYRQGADVPSAIDLMSRVEPATVVSLVADRHAIVSVAGAALGPELLLAMRRHVGADELLFEPVIDG